MRRKAASELDPLFVIADGSAVITVAVRTAFPGCPRGMCWAHVVRNVDKKLLGVRNEEKEEEVQVGPPSFAACNIPKGV